MKGKLIGAIAVTAAALWCHTATATDWWYLSGDASAGTTTFYLATDTIIDRGKGFKAVWAQWVQTDLTSSKTYFIFNCAQHSYVGYSVATYDANGEMTHSQTVGEAFRFEPVVPDSVIASLFRVTCSDNPAKTISKAGGAKVSGEPWGLVKRILKDDKDAEDARASIAPVQRPKD